MDQQENPDTAPPVEPDTSAEPRESESLATAPASTVAEPVLLENPHAVAAAPSESMEGVVTVEASEREAFTIETRDVGDAGAVLGLEPVTTEPTLLENPNEPTPAPSEGSADVVTLEASTPAPSPEKPATPAPSSSSATPSPAVPRVPPAVRALPRRPRLRATFAYDVSDALTVELALMDERRDLIHRFAMNVQEGGAIARIFEALLGVAMQAAAAAGVFGGRVER